MIKAIIFDFDDVIAATATYHGRIESDILNRYGVNISPAELYSTYTGARPADFLNNLINKPIKRADIGALLEEKREKLNQFVKKGIPEVPGAIDLIRRLHRAKYKLAIASSSPLDFVRSLTKRYKIEKYFLHITSADEVGVGKPDPAVFLLTAKKLKVAPANCLVIEDGVKGMIAAKRAGMKCIGLVRRQIAENYPADLLVKSLDKVSLMIIKNLG